MIELDIIGILGSEIKTLTLMRKRLTLVYYFSYIYLQLLENSTSVCEGRRELYVLDKRLHPWSFHLDTALIRFNLTVHLRHQQTEMINTESF